MILSINSGYVCILQPQTKEKPTNYTAISLYGFGLRCTDENQWNNIILFSIKSNGLIVRLFISAECLPERSIVLSICHPITIKIVFRVKFIGFFLRKFYTCDFIFHGCTSQTNQAISQLRIYHYPPNTTKIVVKVIYDSDELASKR